MGLEPQKVVWRVTNIWSVDQALENGQGNPVQGIAKDSYLFFVAQIVLELSV